VSRDAVRASYDAFADRYAAELAEDPQDEPWARGTFAAFAELVGGPVLDVGCGPGPAAAHLHRLGVEVRGLDLSPAMVAIARAQHPAIRFDVGDMAALDATGLGGIVAWYSFIHIPPPERPAVLAGFRDALAPGGHLLLGFQVGDDVRHHDRAFGHAVSLDFHRLRPDAVAALLADAGFTEVARVVRAPLRAEPTPQAHLLARRR
jgi:SAM-dependent methyltransferase